MNVGFISLGCAKNLVDSEYIIGLFNDPFFKIENDPKKCDLILINTCGFIENAKQESIDTILEIAELKQDRLKYLVVCGCLSQRYYDDCVELFPEVDLFIRITDYPKMDMMLSKLINHEFNTSYGKSRKLITQEYSAYLKIGDGCNNHCAYCAIPLIRGKYYSFEFNKIIDDAKKLYEMGVKELNVVAQDTTTYGLDINSSLAALLKELDKIDFKWIRVLYMYPDEITDELLEVMKDSKHVLPYFDIPVQYGNDFMLKKMNRRGSVKLIKERVNHIRELFPDAIVRTTMITGFPYETEEYFNDTLDMVKELKFDSLGAFTFSNEEDTAAFDMPQVDESNAQRRYNQLMETQQMIVFEKNQNRIGKTYEVLVERYETLFKRYVGRSYMSAPDGVDGVVYIKTDEDLKIGSFVNVKINDVKGYDLIGEIIYN